MSTNYHQKICLGWWCSSNLFKKIFPGKLLFMDQISVHINQNMGGGARPSPHTPLVHKRIDILSKLHACKCCRHDFHLLIDKIIQIEKLHVLSSWLSSSEVKYLNDRNNIKDVNCHHFWSSVLFFRPPTADF